jgi:hypothetical protein
MSGKFLLGALLVIPPLAALGHDFYAVYGNPVNGDLDIEKTFHLSDVAWVWRHYALDSYESFRKSFDPETWKIWIFPILAQRTVVLTAIPAVIFFGWQLVAKIANTGMMAALRATKGGGKGKSFAFDSADKKKAPLKYKRK